MDYTRVTTSEEIKIISDLAYLLFPLDYGGYVRKKHIQYFLDKYQSETAIAEQLKNGYDYFIIQDGEKVSGYIGFEVDGKSLKLSKLYLNLDVRGQGIGEQVMHWLKSYAIEKQCNRLELLVLLENKNAIRFYERLGYKSVGVFEEYFTTGYSETNYRMAQDL
ncbi:MAG: GNAT family N-acetyltransferase [Crocinitomix sp.]|nr:GNAT family N-acetyltransferase [Crocinitomix sp.]